MSSERLVSVHQLRSATYPHLPPFSPSRAYAGYPFASLSEESNEVYEGVRSCLRTLSRWADTNSNEGEAFVPFQGVIRPGQTVLLKPNFVKESHPTDPDGWKYVVTHGSVIRAVADFVWIALEGKGTVIVADAPQTDSSFDAIASVTGLDEVESFYINLGLDFRVVDLRKEEWISQRGVIISRRRLGGDPLGYVAVDLAHRSEFHGHRGAGRYYGADYNREEVNYHHTEGRHEYLVSRSALDADVVISLPKLKTHKKVGATLSLKNLVGINGDKNWLPHHYEACSTDPGDERPSASLRQRVERYGAKLLQRSALRFPKVGTRLLQTSRGLGTHVFGSTEDVIRSGNWWGNDTTWRMCLDLNKILLFANADGTLRLNGPQKAHLVVVDGVMAGEGRGPMNPDLVDAGLLMAGTHPVPVDTVAATLMGFDPRKMPLIERAYESQHLRLWSHKRDDVQVIFTDAAGPRPLSSLTSDEVRSFDPHFGWKGHIERSEM